MEKVREGKLRRVYVLCFFYVRSFWVLVLVFFIRYSFFGVRVFGYIVFFVFD